MSHLAGIISYKKSDCQTIIDKAWDAAIKKGIPAGTNKPEPTKHPEQSKWAFVFGSEGYYYDVFTSTFTGNQKDIITTIGHDWVTEKHEN